MPFIANTTCKIARRAGNDAYGQPVFGAWERAVCGIVKFDIASEKTSVRTDSSASRGNAREIQASVRLLFPTFHKVAIGDKIEMLDVRLRVVAAFPRLDVAGKLDHYQVDCEFLEAS